MGIITVAFRAMCCIKDVLEKAEKSPKSSLMNLCQIFLNDTSKLFFIQCTISLYVTSRTLKIHCHSGILTERLDHLP